MAQNKHSLPAWYSTLHAHNGSVEVVSSVCPIMRYPGKADIAVIADVILCWAAVSTTWRSGASRVLIHAMPSTSRGGDEDDVTRVERRWQRRKGGRKHGRNATTVTASVEKRQRGRHTQHGIYLYTDKHPHSKERQAEQWRWRR